jgi:hypothetical protein
MIDGNLRTDWLGLLKAEGGALTEKAAWGQGSTSRKPRMVKLQKVQIASTLRKARARQKEITTLTTEEAYEEMANPKSGAGLQARLYRSGEIAREDAIKWIACAITYRRAGKEAFRGWRRHRKAVEEALGRFCGGGT